MLAVLLIDMIQTGFVELNRYYFCVYILGDESKQPVSVAAKHGKDVNSTCQTVCLFDVHVCIIIMYFMYTIIMIAQVCSRMRTRVSNTFACVCEFVRICILVLS